MEHYNLQAIIAVGYKVNSERAVQFRKWATTIIQEYTIKGFSMDDERMKRGGTILCDEYFEEQLERIREIRLSERKFYQKITDIYATAVDYDLTAACFRPGISRFCDAYPGFVPEFRKTMMGTPGVSCSKGWTGRPFGCMPWDERVTFMTGVSPCALPD